jgi:hypothetical protein
MDSGTQLARSQKLGTKVTAVLSKRLQAAQKKLAERLTAAMLSASLSAQRCAGAGAARQRALCRRRRAAPVLFWQTLWQRGNHFVDSATQGLKPVRTSTTRWCSTAVASSVS